MPFNRMKCGGKIVHVEEVSGGSTFYPADSIRECLMSNMNLPPQLFAALASALRGSADKDFNPIDAFTTILGNLAVEMSGAAENDGGPRMPARLKVCSNGEAHFECGRAMSADDQFVAWLPIRGAQIPILCRAIRSTLVSSNRWLIESAFLSLLRTPVAPDAREMEMERIRRSILG